MVLEEAFRALHLKQAVQPPQTLALFPESRGDFITYLGVLAPFGVFGAKLSPYIVAEPKPLVTAWTVLMSMRTGRPLLLCDSSLLTVERTAATTALAVDKLAAPGPGRLAVIGSGRLAAAHLRHVAGLRPWTGASAYSPNLAASPGRLAALSEAFGAPVGQAASAAEAVRGASAVILATSSGVPVIDPRDVPPGALVTSISTNAPKAREVPPEVLAEWEVWCDFRETTPDTAGEMILAAEAGLWSRESLAGDLPGLCSGEAPPASGRTRLFRSVGLGLEDVAAAYALYRILTENRCS
jgi:L-arginine dehydrogenase